MTNQSREAFEEEMQQANAFRAAKDHDSGYYTWSQLVEILAEYGLGRREHALSEGRRQGLEEAEKAANTVLAHLHNAAVYDSTELDAYVEGQPVIEKIVEEIRALIEGGARTDGGTGPAQSEKAGDAL